MYSCETMEDVYAAMRAFRSGLGQISEAELYPSFVEPVELPAFDEPSAPLEKITAAEYDPFGCSQTSSG